MGQSEEELNKEIKPLDGMKHTDDPNAALLFRIKVIKNHFRRTKREPKAQSHFLKLEEMKEVIICSRVLRTLDDYLKGQPRS